MTASVLERPETLRGCLFMLGGQAFAFDVNSVREVVIFDDYTIVPRASSEVLGIANLRGNLIPIVDIGPLLGFPSHRPGRTIKALVIATALFQVAVVVEAILGMEGFDEVTALADVAGKKSGPWNVGLLRRGDGLVALLDASELITALRPGTRTEGAAVNTDQGIAGPVQSPA